jgi:hypothetical protein
MAASSNGNAKLVEILLTKRASINDQNLDGYTALMLTALNDHHACTRLLLEEKAETKITNNHKETSLIIAAKSGSNGVAKLLIKHGGTSDFEAEDKNGKRAWELAKTPVVCDIIMGEAIRTCLYIYNTFVCISYIHAHMHACMHASIHPFIHPSTHLYTTHIHIRIYINTCKHT